MDLEDRLSSTDPQGLADKATAEPEVVSKKVSIYFLLRFIFFVFFFITNNNKKNSLFPTTLRANLSFIVMAFQVV